MGKMNTIIRTFERGRYFGVEEVDSIGRPLRFFAPAFADSALADVFAHFLSWQRRMNGFDAEEAFELQVAEAITAFLAPHLLHDALAVALSSVELWAAFQCSEEWRKIQPPIPCKGCGKRSERTCCASHWCSQCHVIHGRVHMREEAR